MIFHRFTDDSGHLVETSVVGGLHGMEYAPLHRLKAVFDVRHGTFKNNITCILKIPVAEHAGKQRASVPFTGNIVFRHSHNGNFAASATVSGSISSSAKDVSVFSEPLLASSSESLSISNVSSISLISLSELERKVTKNFL